MLECFLDILDPNDTILEARLYNIVLISNAKFAKDKLSKELVEV